MAVALLEHEVLDGSHVQQILRGEEVEIRRPKPAAAAPPREVKVDDGERAGGLLPPPMVAPKPTA